MMGLSENQRDEQANRRAGLGRRRSVFAGFPLRVCQQPPGVLDPAIEKRKIVELVDDGIHGSGASEQQAFAVPGLIAQKQCERFFVQQTAFAL